MFYKMKRQVTYLQKIFVSDTDRKDFNPEYIQNSQNSSVRNQTTQLKLSKR